MKILLTKFPFVLCAALSFIGPIFGQQVKIAPLPVSKPVLIEQLKGLRVSNPKLTATQFAEAGDILLQKNGIGFMISFDAATCEKVRQARERQQDKATPVRVGATLKSVDAEGARLELPEPHIGSLCSNCYVELPILEITDKDFVVVVIGRNIRFELPPNFHAIEVVLLDAKDQKTLKRKWRIPFLSVPLGISYDENVLYLGFEDPELSQLSLSVFGEGGFQITSREEAEDGGKGKLLELPDSPNQTIKFDRWKNTYIIAFKKPCPH